MKSIAASCLVAGGGGKFGWEDRFMSLRPLFDWRIKGESATLAPSWPGALDLPTTFSVERIWRTCSAGFP